MCFVQNNKVNSAVENILVSDLSMNTSLWTLKVSFRANLAQADDWLGSPCCNILLLVIVVCVDRFLHQGPLSSCQCGELQNLFWLILTVICRLRICSSSNNHLILGP